MSSAPRETGGELSHEDVGSGKPSGGETPGFRYVTWAEVERMSRRVVQLLNGMKFDLVLAITRGGLTPAAMICEAIEMRNVLTVTTIFYSDHGQPFYGLTEPRFLSFPSPDMLEGRSILIVDDAWDTGSTAYTVRSRVLRARPRSVKVAVLHFKPDCNRYIGDGPDFYAESARDWVVYPWETMSSKAPSCASDAASHVDSSEPSSASLKS